MTGTPRRTRPFLRAGSAALLATLAAGAGAVDLPEAMSTVSSTCSSAMGSDNDSYGPLPVGLSSQCDEQGSSPQGRFGEATWQAVARSDTGLGSQTGGVGLSNGDAHATAENINARAAAVTSGTVSFAWRLALASDAPFVPPSIPVRFTAWGEGHLSGEGYEFGGRVRAEVGLQWPGFPASQFSFDSGEHYNFGAIDRSLGGTTVLAVTPGQTVAGWVVSSCQVSAVGYVIDGSVVQPLRSDVGCTVSADPLLMLDQATFDATYGAASFPLAEHYRLDYSPNVPVVPEPAAAWLWLMGLASLAGLVKGRARAVARGPSAAAR